MILWPRCRDQPQPGLVRIMSTMSSPSGAMGRTAVGESTTSHPTGVSGWYIDRSRSGSGIKQRLLTGKASLVTSKSASSIQRSHRYRRDESNEPGVLCMIIIIERPNLGHRVSPRLRPRPSWRSQRRTAPRRRCGLSFWAIMIWMGARRPCGGGGSGEEARRRRRGIQRRPPSDGNQRRRSRGRLSRGGGKEEGRASPEDGNGQGECGRSPRFLPADCKSAGP